jgi:hypothetical protein
MAEPFWEDGQLHVALPKALGTAVGSIRLNTGGCLWPAASTQHLVLQEPSEVAQLHYKRDTLRKKNDALRSGWAADSEDRDAARHGGSTQLYSVYGMRNLKPLVEEADMLPCSVRMIKGPTSGNSDNVLEGGQVAAQPTWELTLRVPWEELQVRVCVPE